MKTKKELIEEAKRRGFDEPVMVKGIDGSKMATTQKGIDEYGYTYDEQMEALFFGEVLIYIRDTWAEIIEEPWKAVKKGMSNEYFVRGRNDKMISGVTCYLKKEQAEAIANALNDLEG